MKLLKALGNLLLEVVGVCAIVGLTMFLVIGVLFVASAYPQTPAFSTPCGYITAHPGR